MEASVWVCRAYGGCRKHVTVSGGAAVHICNAGWKARRQNGCQDSPRDTEHRTHAVAAGGFLDASKALYWLHVSQASAQSTFTCD